MEPPKEEVKKLGIPVGVFVIALLVALIGGGVLTYFYFPQIKTIEKIVNEASQKEPSQKTYSSDQYNYSFSYPDNLRLERTARAEGGYVQESIDLYETTGKIRMSVKVIAKTGVQCPYFSLDQFVHCAFLKWQNVASTPLAIDEKKGIQLVVQGQVPPYDIQSAAYFEKGDFIYELDDFIAVGRIDEKYNNLLKSFNTGD